MITQVPLGFLATALALLAGAAAAQELPIATARGGYPTPEATALAALADGETPAEIGAWAQRVVDGKSTAEPQEAPASRPCALAGDGKAHGEMWAGLGTGGYRSIGGVVTQPLGPCARATVAISRTEGRGWARYGQ